MITTVQVGAPFPDLLHLGRLLPIESGVGAHSSVDFTHTAPGVWTQGSALMDAFYLNSPMRLHRLPGGVKEFELPRESAREFRWRLRDAALSAAERASVQIPPVLRMASEFGADEPLLRVGGVVSSSTDIEKLPYGTIFYTNHPSTANLLGVWEHTVSGDVQLLGHNRRQAGQPVTIFSAPGLPEVSVDEPADPATLGEIALRAWRIGKVYKSRQSWCSVFENTLLALGITKDNLAAIGAEQYGPGDVVRREHAALLPEGSILWHLWDRKQAFAVYIRDDRMTRNKAHTRRLFGFNDDATENSHTEMKVLSTPTEPLAWRISGTYLKEFPNGTTFDDRGGALQTLDDETRRSLSSWHSYQIRSVVTS